MKGLKQRFAIKISARVFFEDVFIILHGNGFHAKYANTISLIAALKNQDLWEKYPNIWKRYETASTTAIESRRDLWDIVEKEMDEKFQNSKSGDSNWRLGKSPSFLQVQKYIRKKQFLSLHLPHLLQ
ncbi:MAG: hypothetical protein WDM80_11995 [Limisphaerales bacterium]